MSTPPKPPERLAEILLEILALSNSTGTEEPGSVSGSDPNERESQSPPNDLASKTVETHKHGRTLRH